MAARGRARRGQMQSRARFLSENFPIDFQVLVQADAEWTVYRTLART